MIFFLCYEAFFVSSIVYPKKIWTYWDGTFSAFLNTTLSYTRTALTDDWSFHLLTPMNYSMLINLSYVARRDNIAPPLFSDYLRHNLLARYGGLWIDASTVITSISLFDHLITLASNNKAEFIGFGSPELPKQSLQSGVMYASQPSQISSCWLEEMNALLNVGFHNYVLFQYRNGVSFNPCIFTNYPEVSVYQVAHAAQQVTLQRRIARRTSLLLLNTSDYIYKLQKDCRWNPTCITQIFSNKTLLDAYPITKFNGRNRRYLDSTNSRNWRYSTDHVLLSVGEKISPTTSCESTLYLFFLTIVGLLLLNTMFHKSINNIRFVL